VVELLKIGELSRRSGVPIATLARQIRGSLIDVLDQDYIRTARAMGLREREIIGQLALKNAGAPAMTIIGIQFAYMLATLFWLASKAQPTESP